MATQKFRGDLAGYPLVNSLGDLSLQASAGHNVTVKLSQTGTDGFVIKDYLDATLFSVKAGGAISPLIVGGRTGSDGTGVDGQIMYRSDTNTFKFHAGGIWTVFQAQPTTRRAKLDRVLDAVPGQANTFYIDKRATTMGYNVLVDEDVIPLIHILFGGQERMYGTEVELDVPGTELVDFSIVRSLSTGPEGPAVVGSLNAIRFREPLPTDTVVWYFYCRGSEAHG